jgi:hypothetical protein
VAAGGAFWFAGIALFVSAALNLANGSMPAAALALIGAAAFLVLPLSRWRQRLDVFEQGLVWHGLIGARRLPRAQIYSATFSQRWRHKQRLDEVRLETAEGAVIWIGLERPSELCELIRVWAAPAASRSGSAPDYATDGNGVWQPPTVDS